MAGKAQGRLRLLLLVAFAVTVFALISPNRSLTLGLLSVAMTLLVMSGAFWILNARARAVRSAGLDAVALFMAKDATPGFITTSEGTITSRNAASLDTFAKPEAETLTAALGDTLANPGSILFRLQQRAQASGSAQEDIAVRGPPLRISVQNMAQDAFVWRIEQVERRQMPRGPETNGLPMVMVGRNDTVLYMNDGARALIGSRAKSLEKIFPSLPVQQGSLNEITTAEGRQKVLVAETPGGAGRRALYFLPGPAGGDLQQGWQVFQDMPVPLIKVAPDGSVQSYNRMASKLIGVQLAEEVHLSQLMEGLGRSIADWLADTVAGRLAQKSEFLRLTRTDKEVFVQVTLNRITEEGEPSLIAVLNDATELKSLEAQFVQSQKMQAIGQLAGGVAHDFNNLLTAIAGHCDLLLLRHDQGDPDYGDLVQINQNANRAAALVGQLLAFSRKQTLRPETVDMRDTMADLTHLLNRLVGEKITLTLSHDPVLKPIRADKRQLEQVLMNLVVNARDAMPAGGEIKILTECVTLEKPMSRDRVSVPPGEYVTVTVSDDGAGIAPEKRQKVFEPFYTTKRTGEGTGLGLSTAYGIIKQTGGFIFMDSELGTGTVFTLYFPALEVSAPAQNRIPKAAAPSRAKHDDGVILLVEDEAPVRAFASRALRLRGYTVLEAESAEAALKTLEDDALAIDVFVTDVVMPGMDGPSWVREALKNRPDVRVVFVSGYAEGSFDEAQTKIPNSVFLPKPFSLSDLTDTVHDQLH
ncbi:PAS domain-containing hybrid sensor histidine kinase/response regulator [Sulfitobacter aestuariivivens]|uniref:histidine kinase n=1 Tax=Sulfitobacter aestuariivivens TaxID=2766981 RepID=A0A927D4K2_9RHOB|nr:PAS domain-containing hybrid sensor histidine kinase/response regulator [Sulfitobacter aestuariivivens]MBD3663302.1 response regulator [Sulfitobacter aestuariivivens]